MAELAIVVDKQIVILQSENSANQLAEFAEWNNSNPEATTSDALDKLDLLSVNYTTDEEVGIIGSRPISIRH